MLWTHPPELLLCVVSGRDSAQQAAQVSVVNGVSVGNVQLRL